MTSPGFLLPLFVGRVAPVAVQLSVPQCLISHRGLLLHISARRNSFLGNFSKNFTAGVYMSQNIKYNIHLYTYANVSSMLHPRTTYRYILLHTPILAYAQYVHYVHIYAFAVSILLNIYTHCYSIILILHVHRAISNCHKYTYVHRYALSVLPDIYMH